MSTPAERADDAQWWFNVTGTAPHWLEQDPEVLELLDLRAQAMLDVALTVLAERRRQRRQRRRAHAVHRSPGIAHGGGPDRETSAV